MPDTPAPDSNCIICMQDDGYEIVGPFASRDALIAYGQRWQAEHGDDPRWQTLYLADPHALPRVVRPSQPFDEMGALIGALRAAWVRCFGGHYCPRILDEELVRHGLSAEPAQ